MMTTGALPIVELVKDELRTLEAHQIPNPAGIRAKLDATENPWPLPMELATELGAVLARVPLNRYPDSRASELRALLAASLDVAPGRLLFGNGSDELIALLITTFSRPRKGGGPHARIAWPVPSFAGYRIQTLAAGCAPLEIPLRADFTLDEERLERDLVAGRPNVVFFALPNNPTGTLWPREAVARIVEKHHDIIVVADEAYFDYTGKTLLDLAARHPNLVVMRTLSKLGLAALRCGFMVADERVTREVEKIRAPYHVGAVNQAAAHWLLSRHRPVLEARVRDVIAERERVFAALQGVERCTPFPSQTNFILFRWGQPGDGAATRLWHALVERGVLVRNFDRPGPLAGCLRANIGTPEENELFLEALRG